MKKSASKTRKTKRTSRAFSTKPRGVSKVILLAVVAIILALGGGMYVLSQNGSLGVSLPMAKAPLNPNCEHNDPDLCKFLNNWAVERSYTMTTISKMEGMNSESVMKFAGADKFQMISKQNDKEISNMISIGETTYTLDYTDNKWWKYTLKTDETTTSDEELEDEMAIDDELSDDNAGYKFIAKEACGSRTCFKYLIDVADPSGMKQYIYFDDKEYLLRKIRMEDEKKNYSETVYDYENVSVSVPSPVKEGNPMSAGAGMSEAEAQKMMQEYQQAGDSGDYSSETPVDDSSEGF